jgi:hypothetical protein
MSFQLQYGSIAEELRKAGLPGDFASRIARVLANSAQKMRSGPVEVDTTPQGLRQVDGSRRKHHLTSLDFLDGDPYHRRRRLRSTEESQRPEQASSLQTPGAPQSTDAPFGVSPGSFTETRSSAGGVEVGLRISGAGAFLTQDPASGTLVGKSLRAEADTGANGFLRFFIEEQAGEYVLKIQLDRDLLRDLIFDMLGLEAPTTTDGGDFPEPPPTSIALVDATLTAGGLCFTRANGAVFCLPTVSCDQQ